MTELRPLSASLLLSATLETAIGLAVIGATAFAGLEGRAAGLGAGAGAALYGFISLVRGHRQLGYLNDAVPVAASATYAPRRTVLRAAVLPSAAGLGVLAGASLAFEPALGAVLAGVLAGGGAAKFVLGSWVFAWERARRVTLFLAPRARRLYVRK